MDKHMMDDYEQMKAMLTKADIPFVEETRTAEGITTNGIILQAGECPLSVAFKFYEGSLMFYGIRNNL